jgi:hypothetical protein
MSVRPRAVSRTRSGELAEPRWRRPAVVGPFDPRSRWPGRRSFLVCQRCPSSTFFWSSAKNDSMAALSAQARPDPFSHRFRKVEQFFTYPPPYLPATRVPTTAMVWLSGDRREDLEGDGEVPPGRRGRRCSRVRCCGHGGRPPRRSRLAYAGRRQEPAVSPETSIRTERVELSAAGTTHVPLSGRERDRARHRRADPGG